MPVLHAIVYGAVQGLSEFLPISSSGHLLLVPWLLGWDDFGGDAALEKTFDVALHLGTLVGSVAYFRRDLVRMAGAVLGNRQDDPERRMAWLLVLAAVPAALVGAAFESTIEEDLGEIWLVAVALIAFGIVLLLADRAPGQRAIGTFGPRDAVLMGVGQALALQPGVSRSGVTMSVGRAIRFERDAAARLSFLMSLPIGFGAIVYEGVDVVRDGLPEGFAASFVWGIVASAVFGYVAVWGLLRLVRTISFAPFVGYRVAFGGLCLVLLATNFR